MDGARIRQAREFRGLTQQQLAERCGVTQAAVARMERGDLRPSAEIGAAVAFATGFPPSFFRRPAAEDFPLGSLQFRGRKTATAASRRLAHRRGEAAWQATSAMLERLDVVPVRLPTLAANADPEYAAALTRDALGLPPDKPVPNVLAACERAGVIVLPIDLRHDEHDAYSLWAGESSQHPVMVLFDDAPGDRQRFSVAHELGHLVMHRAPAGDIETAADRFASAFLLPADVLKEELAPPVTLSDLAYLKPRWGVSLQALVRRARDLGSVTDRQYRYLNQQISARGWKRHEPESLAVAAERPRALRKMAEVLYGRDMASRRLATDAALPGSWVQTILGEPQSSGAAAWPRASSVVPLTRPR